MQPRTLARACAVLLAALALHAQLAAQTGATFTGRLLNSLSGDPVPGATIQLDELRRETMTAQDGTFSFDNVPPGTYHLSVRSQGYSSRRAEITVAAAPAPVMDLTVDPELHFEEVTSVSAEARSPFETF